VFAYLAGTALLNHGRHDSGGGDGGGGGGDWEEGGEGNFANPTCQTNYFVIIFCTLFFLQ
jgi:hypothetical protein